MNERSSITFHVIQTSWGIFVRIDASTSSLIVQESTSADRLSVGYYLRLHQSRRLSEDEREYLKSGLNTIVDLCPPESPTLITIDDIFFVETDFQADSLFWAARMLAADLLGVEAHMPRVEFDKETNKYSFHLSDG